jgi:hypothetical protein
VLATMREVRGEGFLLLMMRKKNGLRPFFFRELRLPSGPRTHISVRFYEAEFLRQYRRLFVQYDLELFMRFGNRILPFCSLFVPGSAGNSL